MAALLLYMLIVAALFAVAAAGAEQVCIQRSWPRRFVWLVTPVASLAFPLAIALTTEASVTVQTTPPLPPSQVRSLDPSSLAVGQPGTNLRVAGAAAPLPAVRSWPVPGNQFALSMNSILAMAWLTSSVCCLLLLLVTWLRQSIRFHRCPQVQLHGAAVTVTHSTGPAVFGFFDSRILVPKWFLDESADIQSVALTHEQQHIAAHDPQALLLGLSLVALAPWNPALWWQLRSLRFAIEADCDTRVLRRGIDASTYAEVLLSVGRYRNLAPVGLMALTARAGSLERRVRAFMVGDGPRGALRPVFWLLLALGVVAVAACVHAPGLASHELRKRPPEDIRPGAVAATAIARAHFPELFAKHFDGIAVVAIVMDREGSLKIIEKHVFVPGTVPADFDLVEENARLGVDAEEDLMYRGGEYPPWTIGPWLDSRNPGRIFIVYEVLKWLPDPARTRARVEAAVAAYDPSLMNTPATLAPGAIQVTVFMNDDGTVNRESKRKIPLGTATTQDGLDPFAALGVKKEQLGRGGYACGLGSPRIPFQICINYAWPRRPDDPSGIADLDTTRREIYAKYPEKQDTQDEAAIFSRYFPDIRRSGFAAVKVIVEGKRQVLMPWILFGRDGRVWDSGLWPTNTDRYRASGAISKELEIRYPGTKIYLTGGDCRFNRVPIACAWIDAQSPIQQLKNVDLRKREDVLLTGTFLEPTFPQGIGPTNPNLPRIAPFDFASGLNLGAPQPVSISLGETSWPLFKAKITPVNSREAQIQISLPASGASLSPVPTDWSQTQVVRIPYGESKILSVSDCCTNVPAHKVDLVLHLQRLGGT